MTALTLRDAALLGVFLRVLSPTTVLSSAISSSTFDFLKASDFLTGVAFMCIA